MKYIYIWDYGDHHLRLKCAQVRHHSPAGTFARVPGRCLRWSPTPPGPRWSPAYIYITSKRSLTSIQTVHTHTLLHTNTFTHRPSYTQSVKLLHTNPFTHRHFDTQKRRHTDPIYTQTLLHTNAYTLTLAPFYIQHQLNRNFTLVFAHRASFRAKGLLQHK